VSDTFYHEGIIVTVIAFVVQLEALHADIISSQLAATARRFMYSTS
jgi:hypothetical protein